jgi:hypothetical protein
VGYVRDNKTGKFSWVEGSLDDGPYVPPTGRRSVETNPTHLLIAVVVLVVVAMVAWWTMRAFKEPSIAIKRIHNHPAEYDGRTVMIRGQIGDVFRVGGSYAYYLMQSRDTIVVYTHGARPKTRTTASVHGSVSIGYLDGAARPVLWESP